ncbi:MAG: tRNA (adenosine(37)-N6)-dimethylallyltransferase MiaA [Zymomonas mobilis]|uniref:tRNA (adenosine(37)-N6)-dimethylallyltransferase MiaA n=1 Tax=Zymomonas mobilis TaxID=542 RepID=UPI0001B70432|nr:tRNA (adenosine(37)-N6)-dimethylallyltransferase MiaA [Zymomonas mobilis]ACV74741.1 tRNA delta(2)-isopentenylpyrophosphate transferase [Zymomonas mobilis subsp. mobilis NCIMB 11163]
MSISESPKKHPVLLIAGPTASGKSQLAIAMGIKTNGIIINADASQLYTDLQILTARPSDADEKILPHRLFGIQDGSEPASAVFWAELAKKEIKNAHESGRLPILVGGTGLYIRTLLEGIAPIPDIDPELREEVRSMSVEEAYSALQQEDPMAADRLRPADKTRIMRALEVMRSTGHPLHYWQQKKTGGIANEIKLQSFVIIPPANILRSRCDKRFDQMLEQGAEKEVIRLMGRQLPADLPIMRAIGVREIASYIRGEIDRLTMIEKAKAATRQYAKRQRTWFRHQTDESWIKIFDDINFKKIDDFAIKLLSI